ncbi:hypothetical protein [Acinetobacter baumannii]|uniref:hypothetical protein n=1 Tax=Acinetobacter baumannii TaxID=470 RepID=UPI000D648523|nr:hypothetical protein [Acinetobacter baumannii]MDB0300247.1 hypothetical protein [Acinetobacter baumannii]
MADQIVTRQDLVDAHYDAETLGEFINGEENTEVTSRLGRTYWTLATINYLISQGQLKISDLQAAIDIAAAAGAGANGWTADLIVDGAETQKQINKKTVTHVECIADLINITNVWDGRTVYVKSVLKPIYGVALPFIAGGNFVYKASSTMQADGFLVVNAPNGRWIKALDEPEITVDDYGAIGDGITDDSNGFQSYCNSPYTGINVRLGKRKAVYLIKKQVDCKLKGLIGNGFSKQNEVAYATSSIRVAAGDFSNINPDLENLAFVNVGAEVRDLQLKGDSVPTIHGLHVSGYNTTISNINIAGFGNQVYVVGATVSFRVSDLMSISAGNAGFYFKDKTGDQSTTAYFARCSWQWGSKPVVFEKEAYGCSFHNIVLEYMGGGLQASIWSNCVFDNIWAESTLDSQPHDWLVNTTSQQSFNNQYSNLYIRTPWINRADPNALAVSNNPGGIQLDNSAIAVASATGGKIRLDVNGLSTLFANWYGASNNPLSSRALLLTTQDRASESNFDTPIVIAAPNGCLWERNRSATDYTPVTKRRLIGANADNTAAYYGVDSYTKTVRKWSTYNHQVSAAGQFMAPMMLTYDAAWDKQQNNAGWVISKESTGIYLLQRAASNVPPMSNPNVIVGGMTLGNKKGSGNTANYSLQFLDTYEGSWNTWSECSGVKIFFKDQAGNLVDVFRFTVMFTLVSGF